MNKTFVSFTGIVITLITVVLMIFTSKALAESLEGKWGVGLRLGPSFQVETLSDNSRGDPGLMVNATASYGITNKFLAGLQIEWEQHTIKNSATDFIYGNESTVSIMPVIEYHPRGDSDFSPYGLLGAGININSFNSSSDLNAACGACTISPSNTLALKGGLGIDYFFTSHMAYNAELDLKLNDGTSDISGAIPFAGPGTSIDNRACSLSLIFGFHYFY